MSECEGGTFRCTVCTKEFILKDEADRHFSEAHSEENFLRVYLCFFKPEP